MEAKIIKNAETHFSANFRKERHFAESYIGIAIIGNEAIDAVDLRIYQTDSAGYVCVWLNCDDGYTACGNARATGYGYHRASMAASAAIKNAGVTLSESIGGVGDGAISRAVEAIAKSAYPDAQFVHVVHAHA